MNAIDELRAYASLLEHSTKIPPVVGLRLGELANEIAKDMQQAIQKTPDGARSKRAWMASDETSPVNTAPTPEPPLENSWTKVVARYERRRRLERYRQSTPEAMLLKEMSDWWRDNGGELHPLNRRDADLYRLAAAAFNIVNS